jgi:hypothetical protein
MKAVQSLLTIVLTGALSGAFWVTTESGPAIGKSRHHISGEGSRGPKTADGVQKSAGASVAVATNNLGTGNTNEKTKAGAGDKGGRNSRRPGSDGPLKKGDNLPGKADLQNAGAADPGKSEVVDRGDSSHHDHDAVHPGKNSSTDVGKSDIVADGPGHKVKKPSDTTKKITTIFRQQVAKDPRHQSGPTNIERNAIGVAIYNDGNPKSGIDPKKDSAKANGESAGPPSPADTPPPGSAATSPGPTATKTITNAVTPSAGHPGNIAADPARTGPIINGTSISRPGSNLASIGGPTKNIPGALSGNSFRPRNP